MRVKQKDNKTVFNSQYRLAVMNFLMELINFIPELINCIFANSILAWADCYTSFESTSHYLIVALTTLQIKNDDGSKYNFGVSRLETVISFVCDLFLVLGYIVISVLSVNQLFHPERPADAIGIFLILKVINIAADTFSYVKQVKAEKLHPSLLNETETAKIRNNLINDVTMGVLVCICFFFRRQKWSWYVSPVATIILIIIFTLSSFRRIRREFSELTDVSTTVENQDKLFDILLDYHSSIKRIKEVNCHYMNRRLHADLVVSFRDEITYGQQKEMLNEISKKVENAFGQAVTRFVIEEEKQDI